jgi:hypothetical protein
VEVLALMRDRGDRGPILWGLRALGGWCVAAGQPARAARLFGAEAAARAGAPIATMEPWAAAQAARSATAVAAARAGLGAAAFAAAWATGAALPLEQAVADALEDAPDSA